MSGQFAASWAEALRRYTEVVGLDPDDAQFPHPSSVDELLGAIEETSQNFAEFRSRKAKLFHVLFEISKPIGIVASVVSEDTQIVFPASTICLGAVSHLINTARGVSSAYDNIVDLLDHMKALLVRLNVYESIQIPGPLQVHFIEMLVTLLEVFAHATKIIKKGTRERITRFTKNVLLGDDGAIGGLVTKLEVLSKREDLLAGALTLVGTRQILDEQRNLHQEMREMQQVLETFASPAHMQLQSEQQYRIAKSILRPSVIPDDNLEAISKKRVPGTGEWVLEQPSFNDWLDNKARPVLCIAGSPGFGKSFIAASIISFLQTRRILQDDRQPSCGYGLVAYFFFRDGNPQSRRVDQCLRDLAYQIYQNDASFQAYFNAHFSSEDDIGSAESIWREVFQKYFSRQKTAQTVYIVLDGLDEAFEEDRETLFNMLTPDPAYANTAPNIQMLLTGRHHVFNELSRVTNKVFPIIHVDQFKNKQDITQYVNLSISKSRPLKRFPSLQKEIAETLTSKSQGMFLWVDLMIRDLGHKTRAAKVREALHEAPKGLTGMVQTVLENYSMMFEDEEEAEDFNNILSWVTCAAAPLPLAVIEEVLRIRLGDDEGEDMPGLEERLRHEWGVLLELKRNDGLTTDDLEGNQTKLHETMESIYGHSSGKDNGEHDIRQQEAAAEEEEEAAEIGFCYDSNPCSTEVIFCHASIGDIFRSGVLGKVPARNGCPGIGVDMPNAAMGILLECLKSVCNTKLADKNDTPLRKYAMHKWLDHVKLASKYIEGVGRTLHEETGVALLELLRDEDIMKDWLPKMSPSDFNRASLDSLIMIIEPCATVKLTSSLETHQWAKAVMAQPIELFRPAGRFVAKQWLQEHMWKVDFCLQVICHMSCLQNEENPVEKVAAPQVLSAKVILEVAQSTGLAKNAEWHRRIAMSLLKLDHLQEAGEHYQAAMDLDPQNWLAPAGLGFVEKRHGRYKEALRLMTLSSEILEGILEKAGSTTKTEKNDLARRYEDIADTALAAGDNRLALSFFKKSLDLDMGRQHSMVQYLKALPRDDTAGIVRIFKSLDVKIEGSTEEYDTYLKSFIYRTGGFLIGSTDFWKVAAAFKSEGQIEWLQNAYRTMIAVAQRIKSPVSEFCLCHTLADLFYVYDDGKNEQAMQIWKTVLQFPSTFLSSNKSLKYLHSYIGKIYGQCQVKNAFQSGIGSQDADRCIKLLEEVCVNTDGLMATNVLEYYNLPLQNLAMGIWNILAGNLETGRVWLLPFMHMAVAGGYFDDIKATGVVNYMTAKILIALGDEAKAVSLMQAISLPGTTVFICEGRCGVAYDRWQTAYCCKICSMDLCERCAETLKNGHELPINVCSPNHSWAYIPGPDSSFSPKEGEIFLNGEMTPLAQFYQQLKKDWQL